MVAASSKTGASDGRRSRDENASEFAVKARANGAWKMGGAGDGDGSMDGGRDQSCLSDSETARIEPRVKTSDRYTRCKTAL